MWHVSGVSCLFEYYTVFFLSLCTSLSFEEKSHASHTTKTNVLTKTAIANINRNSDDGYLKKLTVNATLRCCALTLTVRLNSCTYGCPLSGAVYWPTPLALQDVACRHPQRVRFKALKEALSTIVQVFFRSQSEVKRSATVPLEHQ
jgi:hypothetical protein